MADENREQHELSTDDRVVYEATLASWQHAETERWSLLANFLLANSVMLVAWALVFGAQGAGWRMVVLMLLSAAGLSICILWMMISARNNIFIDTYCRLAERLEEKHVGLAASSAGDVESGQPNGPFLAARELREDLRHRRLEQRRVGGWLLSLIQWAQRKMGRLPSFAFIWSVPLVFAAVYVLLLPLAATSNARSAAPGVSPGDPQMPSNGGEPEAVMGLSFTGDAIIDGLANVAEAVAWPAAFLLAILLMRTRLDKMLAAVRLDRIKYKDLEIAFKATLAEAKKDSEAIASPLPAAEITVPNPLARAYEMASVYPAGAILDAWTQVVGAAREALRAKGAASIPQHPWGLGTALKRAGVLADNEFEFFHRLRQVRNIAAHMGGAGVDAEDAEEFVELAARLIAAMADG